MSALKLVALGRSFARRPLHKVVVLVEGVLLGAIQRLALLLVRTPGLLPVRLSLTGQESGAVFGLARLERPERVGLVIPALRGGRTII